MLIHLKYTVYSLLRRICFGCECSVLHASEYHMVSLQSHRSEPATQTSFGVTTADALPHPGFVMGTMTVVT